MATILFGNSADYDLIAVGKIVKSFGAEGELSVTLYDNFPEDFNKEEEAVFVELDKRVTPLFFNRLDRRGKERARAAFDDFNSELRISWLIGKEFSMMFPHEPQHPIALADDDDDEVYLEDLVGYTLLTAQDNVLLGKIIDFQDDEFNPLFEAELSDGRRVLIPAQDDFIVEIKLSEHALRMQLPDGLLDL